MCVYIDIHSISYLYIYTYTFVHLYIHTTYTYIHACRQGPLHRRILWSLFLVPCTAVNETNLPAVDDQMSARWLIQCLHHVKQESLWIKQHVPLQRKSQDLLSPSCYVCTFNCYTATLNHALLHRPKRSCFTNVLYPYTVYSSHLYPFVGHGICYFWRCGVFYLSAHPPLFLGLSLEMAHSKLPHTLITSEKERLVADKKMSNSWGVSSRSQ